MKTNEYCEWRFERIGCISPHWVTQCGYREGYDQGNLEEIEYKFCPHCGKKIKETEGSHLDE